MSPARRRAFPRTFPDLARGSVREWKEDRALFTVVFKIPNSADVKVAADAGDNILELAQKAGVKIDAPCSGNGVCGKCRLRLIAGAGFEGFFSGWHDAEHLRECRRLAGELGLYCVVESETQNPDGPSEIARCAAWLRANG